jgi:hypothetical protein
MVKQVDHILDTMGPEQTIEEVSLISILGRPQNNSLSPTITFVTHFAE